jgi:hypothetical protein
MTFTLSGSPTEIFHSGDVACGPIGANLVYGRGRTPDMTSHEEWVKRLWRYYDLYVTHG